jgi:hypothetical protein
MRAHARCRLIGRCVLDAGSEIFVRPEVKKSIAEGHEGRKVGWSFYRVLKIHSGQESIRWSDARESQPRHLHATYIDDINFTPCGSCEVTVRNLMAYIPILQQIRMLFVRYTGLLNTRE